MWTNITILGRLTESKRLFSIVSLSFAVSEILLTALIKSFLLASYKILTSTWPCCVSDERQKVYSFICSNLPPPAEEREEAAARAGTTAREREQKTLLF